MLRSVFCIFAALSLIVLNSNLHAEVYELRTYTTNEGKLEALESRFRDHTMKLFEKHGIENVGYWIPTEGEEAENTLIYVIKHASRDAAKTSWKAFGGDKAWTDAYKASIADGRLVKKVESVYMDATDYSPEFKSDSDQGVFELRVYTTAESKLSNLNARFRDHTVGLFERHGIKNVAYWVPSDEPNSNNTLIYIIKHESREAAGKSWKNFLADPDWKKAAKASQIDGRILAKAPESTYMKATDYSPIK